MKIQDFPALNASLNATSAVLLLSGYILIKLRKVRSHATLMICAVVTSTAFLACYLIYHAQTAPRSLGVPPGLFRTIYFSILISHTILAVVILPLIAMTLLRAYRRQWERHRRISLITFPLWFYVSVTGVIIYWMLYRVAPGMGR